MKCELCHQANAEAVLTRIVDGEESELYVCKACALAEKRAKQKRSQRTRKPSEASGETIASDNEPPPIIGALIHAVNNVMSDLEKDFQQLENQAKNTSSTNAGDAPQVQIEPPKFKSLSLKRVCDDYLIRGYLHLEGLYMIGEIAAVERATAALGLSLEGICVDGVNSSGHAYRLLYTGSPARARRVLNAILEQEEYARRRLLTEMTRIFLDATGRALAILKNARLISFGELFDLLSALRIALLKGMVDGLTRKEFDNLINDCDLSGYESKLTSSECDRIDGDRADEVNRLFEDVMLNDLAEEIMK